MTCVVCMGCCTKLKRIVVPDGSTYLKYMRSTCYQSLRPFTSSHLRTTICFALTGIPSNTIQMSTNNPLSRGPAVGMTSAEEAISRTQILALINRYASLARGIPDPQINQEIASLFLPKATISLPDGRVFMPSEVGKITESHPPELLRHHVTTVDVQFDSDTEAKCQTYIIAGTHLKMPDHWGRWDDVVTKTEDGRWLFARKVILVDGMDEGGWLQSVVDSGVATKNQ